MAAVRVFNYTVSVNSITPSEIAKGGVQGEHNATQLNFNVSSELMSALRALNDTDKEFYYRFDAIDGLGERHSFDAERLSLEAGSITLPFLVGNSITRHGGIAQIYLIITVSEASKTQLELYSYSVKLAFKATPDADSVTGESFESVSTLAMMAKANAQIAEAAKAFALEAQAKTEAAKATIDNGTEWIFDGGSSVTELEMGKIIDTEMSDTSANAVRNSTVKSYIDNTLSPLKTDYVTEYGTSGIWSWRKWASGFAECWGNTAVKAYTVNTAYANGYYSEREYVSFPNKFFVSTPSASVIFNTQNYGIPLVSVGDSGPTGIYLLIYEAVSTTRNGFYIITAKGRWKE